MHNMLCVKALSSLVESSCDHKHWQISFLSGEQRRLVIALVLFGSRVGKKNVCPALTKAKLLKQLFFV